MRMAAPLVFAVLTLSATTAHAAIDPALDKVLRQLDASSERFQSAEADLKWDYYEKVVHDTSTQTGSIYFERESGGIQMGAVISSVGKKYIHFAKGVGNLYDTVARKVTSFAVGANRSTVESVLALGFGGSGKDLERSWDVSLAGTENVDGVQTAKLELVPKDKTVANTFTHVTMWIDTARDIPLKQVSYTPEGDTRTATYTNIRYNSKVDAKKYAAPKH